jgi:hypothetical protein
MSMASIRTRAQSFLRPGRDITLVLHVEGAPVISLTFDRSEPFVAAKAKLTIGDRASVVDPDRFASALEVAVGALPDYWMQRSAWPPDVRPAEDGS